MYSKSIKCLGVSGILALSGMSACDREEGDKSSPKTIETQQDLAGSAAEILARASKPGDSSLGRSAMALLAAADALDIAKQRLGDDVRSDQAALSLTDACAGTVESMLSCSAQELRLAGTNLSAAAESMDTYLDGRVVDGQVAGYADANRLVAALAAEGDGSKSRFESEKDAILTGRQEKLRSMETRFGEISVATTAINTEAGQASIAIKQKLDDLKLKVESLNTTGQIGDESLAQADALQAELASEISAFAVTVNALTAQSSVVETTNATMVADIPVLRDFADTLSTLSSEFITLGASLEGRAADMITTDLAGLRAKIGGDNGLETQIAALRQGAESFEAAYTGIKDVLSGKLMLEINRLEGARDILTQIANEEERVDVRERLLEVVIIIGHTLTTLREVDADAKSLLSGYETQITAVMAKLQDLDGVKERIEAALDQIQQTLESQALSAQTLQSGASELTELSAELFRVTTELEDRLQTQGTTLAALRLKMTALQDDLIAHRAVEASLATELERMRAYFKGGTCKPVVDALIALYPGAKNWIRGLAAYDIIDYDPANPPPGFNTLSTGCFRLTKDIDLAVHNFDTAGALIIGDGHRIYDRRCSELSSAERFQCASQMYNNSHVWGYLTNVVIEGVTGSISTIPAAVPIWHGVRVENALVKSIQFPSYGNAGYNDLELFTPFTIEHEIPTAVLPRITNLKLTFPGIVNGGIGAGAINTFAFNPAVARATMKYLYRWFFQTEASATLLDERSRDLRTLKEFDDAFCRLFAERAFPEAVAMAYDGILGRPMTDAERISEGSGIDVYLAGCQGGILQVYASVWRDVGGRLLVSDEFIGKTDGTLAGWLSATKGLLHDNNAQFYFNVFVSSFIDSGLIYDINSLQTVSRASRISLPLGIINQGFLDRPKFSLEAFGLTERFFFSVDAHRKFYAAIANGLLSPDP